METKRQLDVLDRRLAESEYVASDRYTIADVAIWPWCGDLAQYNQYGGADFLQVQGYKNLQRWTTMIGQRPAAKRRRKINRLSGECRGSAPRAARRQRLRNEDAG